MLLLLPLLLPLLVVPHISEEPLRAYASSAFTAHYSGMTVAPIFSTAPPATC